MNIPSYTSVSPTYNWAKELDLLLVSLLKQTVLQKEVIITEDGLFEDNKN